MTEVLLSDQDEQDTVELLLCSNRYVVLRYFQMMRFTRYSPYISLQFGNPLAMNVDAVVIPTDTFGGFRSYKNYRYRDYFGEDFEENVRDIIKYHHYYELLVGEAMLVETYHPSIPYAVIAPVIRDAYSLPEDSPNIYLAARGIMKLLWVDKVFCPCEGKPTLISDVIKRVAMDDLTTHFLEDYAAACFSSAYGSISP